MAKPIYPRYTAKQFEKLTSWSQWPSDHKAIARAVLVDGLRQVLVARTFGVTPQVVRNLVHRAVPLVDIHRIALIERESSAQPVTWISPPPAHAQLTKALRDDILRLRKQGVAPNRIQSELRVPMKLIREVVRAEGGPTDKPTQTQAKQVISLRKSGLSYQVIAKETGLTLSAVRAVLPSELSGRKPRKLITAALKKQIVAMRKQGKTYQDIARDTGVLPVYLAEIIPPELRGKRPATAKALTPRLLQRVTRLRKKGYTYDEIARDTGVSVAAIRTALPAQLRGRQISA